MVSIARPRTGIHSVCLLSPDDLRDSWDMPHVHDLPNAEFDSEDDAAAAAMRLADACATPADPWLGELKLVKKCDKQANLWGCRLDECAVAVLCHDPDGKFWGRKKTHTYSIAGRRLAACCV